MFMRIFDISNAKIDLNALNNICNSFLQRKFGITHKSDCNIFAEFENIIDEYVIDNDLRMKRQKIIEKLRCLCDVIGRNYLNANNISLEDFASRLISGDDDSLNVLHKMTNLYIMKLREKYVKENLELFFQKLNIKIKIKKSSFKNVVVKTKDWLEIIICLYMIDDSLLTKEERGLLNNMAIFQKLCEFKRNPSSIPIIEIKPYLDTFNSLLNKLYDFKCDEIMKGIPTNGLPMVYTLGDVNVEFVLDVMSSVNVDQVVNKLLCDDDSMQNLIQFLNKYKIFGWNNIFEPVAEETDLVINPAMIASLISNFYDIENRMKKHTKSLTKFIDYANCYDSSSKKYALLLGKDNFYLIYNNEGSYKSNTTRKYRLDMIPKLVKMMYNKDKITIPPINKTYHISGTKDVKVVIGDSTNMNNLTYGEKTNSCLRVGGSYKDLFEFCLKDKNGFHIVFEDPKTHKFITRVSGIRNGNTIFLNELRYSVNKKYDDEEIIEVLKQVCEDLISSASDEKVPIENIVISTKYAMEKHEDKAVSSNLRTFDDPFLGLNFDIKKGEKLLVLKTTNADNSLVPYKFGRDISRTYLSIRGEVIYSEDGTAALNNYNRVTLIDGIMKDISFDGIIFNSPENIVSGASGEDWSIVVDDKNNFFIITVENSKRKAKQKNELNDALGYLRQKFISTGLDDNENTRR